MNEAVRSISEDLDSRMVNYQEEVNHTLALRDQELTDLTLKISNQDGKITEQSELLNRLSEEVTSLGE